MPNAFEQYLDRITDYGNATAFIEDDEPKTYTNLIAKKDFWLEFLKTKGLPSGSKVAVVGDFNFETVAFVFALAQHGTIIIPLTIESNKERERVINVTGIDFAANFTDARNPSFEFEFIQRPTQLLDQLALSTHAGLVLFSSGSTGKPKGIVHDLEKVIGRFSNPRKSHVAIPLLMFDHFGGYNTVFGLLSSGSTIVVLKNRGMDSIFGAVEKWKVTLLPTTPSFLSLALSTQAYKKYDLLSLEKMTYGTEVMPVPLLEKLNGAFTGVKFQQTYGLSEVGVLDSQSRNDGSTWVKLGGKGFDVKIVDGYLYVKSDFAMLGYIGTEEELFDSEGWFNTQDQVEVDGEYMRILGRKTDQITVGGQKVFPVEVENIILKITGVQSVRVRSEPHRFLGNVVVCDVVASADFEHKLLKTEIVGTCRQLLSNYKVPQKVYFLDTMPMTVRLKREKS
jgi:acyl-coenzyme A synthetase/AMP-(fatty) acid ligase